MVVAFLWYNEQRWLVVSYLFGLNRCTPTISLEKRGRDMFVCGKVLWIMLNTVKFAFSLIEAIRLMVKFWKAVNQSEFVERVLPDDKGMSFKASMNALVELWEQIESTDAGMFFLIENDDGLGKEDDEFYN